MQESISIWEDNAANGVRVHSLCDKVFYSSYNIRGRSTYILIRKHDTLASMCLLLIKQGSKINIKDPKQV